MKRCILFLALLLAGCEENNYNGPSKTEPVLEASASFDWNYLSQNQVQCLGQGCGIQFLDRSANARRWLWSFGDGGNSGLKDPVHFYRDDNCGRNSNCSYVVNLQVCPEPDLRFDDERCSVATSVVIVPPPS